MLMTHPSSASAESINHVPTGWRRFIYSTNHKDIGTMYPLHLRSIFRMLYHKGARKCLRVQIFLTATLLKCRLNILDARESYKGNVWFVGAALIIGLPLERGVLRIQARAQNELQNAEKDQHCRMRSPHCRIPSLRRG